MTTPVSATRPAANAPSPTKPAAPAANAPAATGSRSEREPGGAPMMAGDTVAFSAKATAPAQKTVVIDGKEYELRETGKRKWPTWEKAVTWTCTGVGGVAGIFGGAFAALAVDFSGALNPASIAAFAVGWAVCAGIGYLTGRVASKGVNGVAGWFK